MAQIAGIKGISYVRYRGGWKLRWRETHETATGLVKRSRSYTVEDEAEVPVMAVQIRGSLDRQGYWEPGGTEVIPMARPMEVDIEAVAGQWLIRKVGRRRLAPATKANLKGALKRFFEGVRAVVKLPDGPIPARYLNRDVVEQVTVWLGDRYAEGTVYQTLHPVLREMWPWASDRGIAGLEPAPRDTKSLMPRNAVYAPPNVLPTLVEVDAMIGRITVPRAKTAAVLMRGAARHASKGESVCPGRQDDWVGLGSRRTQRPLRPTTTTPPASTRTRPASTGPGRTRHSAAPACPCVGSRVLGRPRGSNLIHLKRRPRRRRHLQNRPRLNRRPEDIPERRPRPAEPVLNRPTTRRTVSA